VQTANYLEQAKSFLSKNALRIALRAAPLALFAVGVAHALPANSVVWGTPTSSTVSSGCGASGSNMGGITDTNGLRLRLYGLATGNSVGGSPCTMTMSWVGTGSGPFYGNTGTLNANFSIAETGFATVSGWVLTVTINGNALPTYTCTASAPPPLYRGFAPRGGGTTCLGSTTLTGQTFPVSGSLSTWRVDLAVTANYSDGGTVTVNVPGLTSIDLLAQTPAINVPALSPAAFIMTGILLFSLAGFGLLRRTSADQGFPG